MPASALELARLAEQRQEPRRALAAIAALRDRLDELETVQVENARRLGWSWSEIAQPLGISRQAVHHKHARRGADGGRRDRRGRMTVADVRRCVARASREAGALGHDYVGTDHLLLALLVDDAAPLLEELRISPERVREAIAERRGGDRAPAGAGVAPSSSAPAVLDGSLRQALAVSAEGIAAEHLLLALLRDDEGAASQVLARLGVSTEDVERGVNSAR